VKIAGKRAELTRLRVSAVVEAVKGIESASLERLAA
jgi:hypothetical protein